MIKFWLSGIIIILYATCGPSFTVDTLVTVTPEKAGVTVTFHIA